MSLFETPTRPGRPRLLTVATAAAAAALLLAGCGSTVQLSGAESAAEGTLGTGTAPDSLSAPGSTTAGTGAGSLGTPGAASGAGGAGATGTTGAGSTGTPGAAGSPAGAAATGTGPVKVGLMYLEGAEQSFGAIGLDGVSTGDTRAQADAIVRHLNSNGGLAGRPVQLVYAPVDTVEAINNQQAALATACAQLTQDDRVAFVVTYIGLTVDAMACFAKAGVGVLNDVSALGDAAIEQYGDYLASPGDISSARLMRNLVDSLWRTGWLTESSVVGAFSTDDQQAVDVVEGPLAAALARYGLEVEEHQRVAKGDGGISQSNGAVLRFNTAGVDRIIPVLINPIFLMNSASSQGYRPSYALYTSFGPGALLESSAPRDQLQGAAGIGWQPALDIGRGTKPAPVSPNETLCLDLMRESGQQASSATVKGFQLVLCNSFFYLAHAAEKVGSVPGDLLARARAAVGTSFQPSDTFRTDMTSRSDGVAAYRPLAYTDGCSCFQYVGDIRATS